MKNGVTRVLLLLAAAAAAAVRTVQLFFYYDAATGFTTDGGLISGVLLGLGVLSVFLPYLCSEGAAVVLPTRRRLLCSLGALLGAAALLASAYLALRQRMPEKAALAFSPLTRVAYVLQLAGAALTGITLLYLALCHVIGWRPYAHVGWLCLVPVLTVCARSLYLFAVYTPVNGTLVNLLNLSALGLALGFFTRLGRSFAEGEPAGNLRPLLLYGAGAGAVGLASSLPNLLCWVQGMPCVQNADLPYLLGAAGLAVYAFTVALSMSCRPKSGDHRRTQKEKEENVDNFAQDLAENS